MSKKLPKGYTYNPNNQLLCLRFTYRGNRKAVYGHTYKECEAKKAELIDSLKNHMHIDNQKITLDRFYSTWETEQAKTVKPQTIDHNRKSWVYISRYLGKLKIVDINKNDVLQLQNDVLQISTADNANRVVKLLKQTIGPVFF